MANNPLFLATAIEAVIKAGDIQMGYIDSGFQVSHKGTIDLVTEADVAVETMFRKTDRRAFPRSHDPGRGVRRGCGHTRGVALLGVRSDRRHQQLRAWTADFLFVARARDRRQRGNWRHLRPDAQRAVRRRAGRGSVSERKAHSRVRFARRLVESMLVTGFPYDIHKRIPEIVGLFGEFVGCARAVRRLGSAALDLCYVASGRMDGFWEQDLKPWDIAAGTIIVEEAGGRVTDFAGEPSSSRRHQLLATNGKIHDDMLRITDAFLRSQNLRISQI